MKIITWNVNSIRARLERLIGVLRRHEPDVVCLQETKTTDDRFPREVLTELGYQAVTAGQKTYNGTALISRTPAEDVIREYSGKWYFADVKDCEISPRMLYRQGIIGNWWWQYRVPGRGSLDWSRIGGALIESGYDYVMCVENEDRGMPGLEGFAYGCRHLRQVLPRKGEYERPSGPWKIR